jgi:cell fate regulator YaaT (PSP1 superfamily)
MQITKLQLYPWDKAIYADAGNLSLKRGDWVLFRYEFGPELGEVVGFEEVDIEKFNAEQGELRQILRYAEANDYDRLLDPVKKAEIIKTAKELVHQYDLDMKLVDAHTSYDNTRLTLAFIADGRIDFRELVKDLQRRFNQTIRLQQIGIRDEARITGDCGHCGRSLCCKGHVKEFMSITSDMAEAQQCEHRGSDRISGSCGRLMCCLSYEEKGYKDLAKDMPAVGTQVNVDGRKGEVINRQILKRTVNVKFQDKETRSGYIIQEIDLDRKKKTGKEPAKPKK